MDQEGTEEEQNSKQGEKRAEQKGGALGAGSDELGIREE